MEISAEQISRFQALYAEAFGREIDADQAREKGERLVRLLAIILKNSRREDIAK